MIVYIKKRGETVGELHNAVTVFDIMTAQELCLDKVEKTVNPKALFVAMVSGGETMYYALDSYYVKVVR